VTLRKIRLLELVSCLPFHVPSVHVSETVAGAEVGALAEVMFHLTLLSRWDSTSRMRLWAWEHCVASGSQRDCGNVSNNGQAFWDIGLGVHFGVLETAAIR
jgi:hypothetical protein